MSGGHPLERVDGPAPHLIGHRAVAQDALRRDEARQHRRKAGDAPFAVAGDETLMEIGRHDAELRAQLEYVPIVVAKHTHGWRVVRKRQRTLFVRQQPDQDRLAGAVGPRIAVCSPAPIFSVRP